MSFSGAFSILFRKMYSVQSLHGTNATTYTHYLFSFPLTSSLFLDGSEFCCAGIKTHVCVCVF